MLKKFADLVTLMVHGAIWRIGDGRSIKIWSDKWIPNSLDNVIHWDQNPDIDVSQTVSDIIIPDSNQWGVEKMRGMFSESTCLKVCSIPLRRTRMCGNLLMMESTQ